MASFATEVKNELTRKTTKKRCCQTAELAALLRMGASMTIGTGMMLGLSFVTENAAVARRTLQLLKAVGQVRTEVTVSRSKRLKKNNRYTLRVAPSPQVRPLIEDMGMLGDSNGSVGRDNQLLKKRCCRQAYLRGAFLGGGSINRPDALCHLEMVTASYGFGDTLINVLRRLDIPAGFTDRKGKYLVYVKDGEAIMDLLSMMGAVKTLDEYESGRNLKEVRSQVNRLVNCETANLQRSVVAAVKQMEAIEQLQETGCLEKLPLRLRKTARARLENPEASLTELADVLLVTKSCVSHRLQKLLDLAEEAVEQHQ